MRVLTLGWEFPPFFAGGIGIVCYELTRALSQQDVDVLYLMPFGPRNIDPGFLTKMIVAENMAPRVTVKKVDTILHAYMSSAQYQKEYKSTMLEAKGDSGKKKLYGKDLMQEVHNFAHRAVKIALEEDFDIIHCHDWMTIPAAVWLKQLTGKPLIYHVHNTVYDRYLGGSNTVEKDIEQRGLDEADVVVTVSDYVQGMLRKHYRIEERKLRTIHNAAQLLRGGIQPPRIAAGDKVVLFAGRITAQKGPEYFVQAARHVADYRPDVKFVMAGTGDMLHRMIELAADLGLADKFLFPGFYTRDDVERLFAMADCFVMPSVSEPFGIVPLEAMSVGTPTIISKQSGVAEVLQHVLKADFWNTRELAEKILAVLAYEELHDLLKEHGEYEVKQMTWEKTATKVKHLYEELLPLVREVS